MSEVDAPPKTRSRTSGKAPAIGRWITMLVDPEPTTLVAMTNCADPTMLVSGKVSEGLLTYDDDFTPRPQLAIAWAVERGGLDIRFSLRPGVRWHDGAAFTSADVAFSIDMLKRVHPRGRSTFAQVIDVQTPDPLTAVIRLERPAPAILLALAGAESPMIPRHRYREDGATAGGNEFAPIGTGPFRFVEWIRGDHIRLVRNPDYWDAPKPAVAGIIIRFFASPAEALAAIERGEIDIAPAAPVPVTELNRLSTAGGRHLETHGYRYTNQLVRLEFNLDHPILAQHHVRQAIAQAIDRQRLVAEAWMGFAVPAYGPISPEMPVYGLEPARVPRLDIEAANRALDAAGFARDATGVRLRLPLDFVPAGDGYERTADRLVEDLRAIGIAATVRRQTFADYIRRIYTDRDFAMTVGRGNSMFDPSVGVQRLYWSKNFRLGLPFSNGSHYASAVADDLLEQAAVEADPARRLQLFQSFQQQVVTDLPDVSLLAPTQITLVNPHLRDHTVSADGPNGNFADLKVI